MDERDLTESEVLILNDFKFNDNHQTNSSLIYTNHLSSILYSMFLTYIMCITYFDLHSEYDLLLHWTHLLFASVKTQILHDQKLATTIIRYICTYTCSYYTKRIISTPGCELRPPSQTGLVSLWWYRVRTWITSWLNLSNSCNTVILA